MRLIYAGTSATDTSAFISTRQAYNTNYNNKEYLGYMYTMNEQHGTGTNSDIKTVVDNWYASNLNSYTGYISKTAIHYAAKRRLLTNRIPTFVCSDANDRFTASTATGNAKLTYPIGLITAGEINYAGGLLGTNN